jgi:hypothetical protein
VKYTIDQSFRCASVDRFIEVYFSEGFNNAVSPHIGLKSRELVERRALDDGRVERRVRMQPTVQLPPALAKIVGGRAITYDEVSAFDPAAKKADYFVDSAIKDRLEVKGVVEFLPDGDGRVRRVIHAEVNARVIGLRSIIEKLIRREVESSYEKIARFMQTYIDELGDDPVA